MSKPIIKVKDTSTGTIYNIAVAICVDTNNLNDINSYRYGNNSLAQLTPVWQPEGSASITKTYQVINELKSYNGFKLKGAVGSGNFNFDVFSNASSLNPSDSYMSGISTKLAPPWSVYPDYTPYDITPQFCFWANKWDDETGTFDYTASDFVCGYLFYQHIGGSDNWSFTSYKLSKSSNRRPQYLFAGGEPYKRYNEITGVEVGEETIDNTSDNIEQETETSLIGLSTLHTGEIDAPNISNLSSAFSDDTTVNFLKSYFTDVFDAVTSLMIAPFELESAVDVISTASNMNIFGYSVGSVEYHPALKSIKRISCGTLHITPRYGNFMDFSPYSSYQLFVPYYGYVSLNADDVVGSDIELYYDVNISTGTFTAFIKCSRVKNGIKLNSILYQLSGNMYYSIPLSRADFRTYYANLNSNMYSLGSTLLGAVGSAVSGNVAGVASSTLAVANSVNNMSHEKVQLQRSGAIDTGSNLTTLRIPHMVISHANLSVSETLASENGYYSNVSYKLSELSGFTKIKSINLSISGCTDNERNQIESLLKSGVIL